MRGGVTAVFPLYRHRRDHREVRFIERTVAAGAGVRLPRLLRCRPPEAVYQSPVRHGVTVVAAPTVGLCPGEVEALLRFRFAQYLDIGFVDPHLAYANRMCAEPASAIGPLDIHLVAGLAETGEILGYTVLRQPPSAPEDCRMRVVTRPLFEVERVHGAGVYNQLPILPDLAVGRIRELGLLIKNRHCAASQIHQARAVVELGAAVVRLMTGPLGPHVDAMIGESETYVAQQNLDFYEVPSVVIHGTVPNIPSTSYLCPRYQCHAVRPFACLTSDITAGSSRMAAISAALDLPGKKALLALLRLKQYGGEPAVSMLSCAGNEGMYATAA